MRCGHTFWGKNRQTSTLNLSHVSCKQWSCTSCRRSLTKLWSEHFSTITADVPIYRSTCEISDWSAHVYRRVHRSGARYFTVAISPTRRAVYTDKPIGLADEALTLNAVERFRRDIDSHAHTTWKHPVSSCHEWALPKPESKYEHLGMTRTTPTTLRKVAAEFCASGKQVTLQEWTSDLSSGIQVKTLSLTNDEIIERCKERQKSSTTVFGLQRENLTTAPNRRDETVVARYDSA